MHYKETKYGFEYGAASVNRFFSNKKTGAVFIEIKTPKQAIEIYVTKTGFIKIYQGQEIISKPQNNMYNKN